MTRSAPLREVLQRDPNNDVAQRLLREVAERLAQTAEEAYAVGFMQDAVNYLDLALAVMPDVVRWREQRDRWISSQSANEVAP